MNYIHNIIRIISSKLYKSRSAVILGKLISGFQSVSSTMTKVVNFILLSITYFIGIGSIWIISNITKKYFLNLNPKKNTDSYWQKSNMGKEDKKSYYHQF